MDKLNALKQTLSEFAKDRDWDKFHSPKNLAVALSVEAGELLEIFQWLTDEEAKNSASNQKIKTRTREELADIFIYLLRLADKMGIDIFEAAFEKVESNAKKYPIELSKGNALKYTERNNG